ncbi:MAG TPA: transcription-repair coupling factor, partial [Candidatus Binatia bacterium]|nr:transcription-repair coupling factor [Candidatus Binatia bacterium]
MTDLTLSRRLEHFLRGNWSGAKRVQGLQGGARAYVLSLAATVAKRPLVVIAAGAGEAEKLHEDLSFFLGEQSAGVPLAKRLHRLPAWEVLPFENLSPHPDDVAGRLQALYKLIEDPAPILIATPAALMQKVVSREDLKQSYLYLVAGQELSRDALLEHLVGWGFQNVPLVEERGDFSARGGIVDLFSPGYARPIRLEFDGDRIESIREFNPSTQRSERAHEEMLLLPMKEFSLRGRPADEVVRRLDERALELDMDRRERNRLIESVRQGIPFPGIEFLLPYFRSNLTTVFS